MYVRIQAKQNTKKLKQNVISHLTINNIWVAPKGAVCFLFWC